MKRVICKQAETRSGKTTVTVERGGATLVFKGVPAQVCPNCGEEYVDEVTTKQVFRGQRKRPRTNSRSTFVNM